MADRSAPAAAVRISCHSGCSAMRSGLKTGPSAAQCRKPPCEPRNAVLRYPRDPTIGLAQKTIDAGGIRIARALGLEQLRVGGECLESPDRRAHIRSLRMKRCTAYTELLRRRCSTVRKRAGAPMRAIALQPGSGSGHGDGGMGRGTYTHGAVAERMWRSCSGARAPGCHRGRRCVTRSRWEEHSLHTAAVRIAWPIHIPFPSSPDKTAPPPVKSREVARPNQSIPACIEAGRVIPRAASVSLSSRRFFLCFPADQAHGMSGVSERLG